ncbi:MAG: hypothetical protein IMZ61_12215 [Planctomycetes bacterium]|nr:hypothetical protein [Planctomycetota bacterium]
MENTPTSSSTASTLLADIALRLKMIELTSGNLDRAINGNGKPGLVEDHRTLQHLVEVHLEQAKQDTEARTLLARETQVAKELLASETKTALGELAKATADKKEKMSARTWAVMLAVIVAVLGMLSSQVAIYMQLLRTP